MKRKTTFAKSIMLTVFSVCIVTALCMSTAFAAESDATLDIADQTTTVSDDELIYDDDSTTPEVVTDEAAPDAVESEAAEEVKEVADNEPLEETENPQDTEQADKASIIDPTAELERAQKIWLIGGCAILLLAVGVLALAYVKGKKKAG